MERYKHTPLQSPDSIRLLDLLPSSSRDAPLTCKIREIKLKKARSQYEALSYVWGGKQGSEPIICDGQELLVTPNCRDALVTLRRRYLKRTLWIDAICIDQTPQGEPERNEQVKLMGQVYKNASIVLVWLGLEELPLTVKDHLVLWGPNLTNLLIHLPLIMYYRAKENFFDYILELGDKWEPAEKAYFASLLKLVEHPWFTRVWTVQEFAFGRKCVLLSGTTVLKWAPLELFARILSHRGILRMKHDNPECQLVVDRLLFRRHARLLASFEGQYTRSIWAEWYKEWAGHRSRLINMTSNIGWQDWNSKRLMFLRSIRDLDSELPHDKIYGIYSILEAMGVGLPEPDYSKPVQEVVQSLTRALITITGSLDSIMLDLPPLSNSTTPSWVPDYLTSRGYKTEVSIQAILQSELYVLQPNASNSSKAHEECSAQSDKLLVQGKRMANIGQTLTSHTSVVGQELWEHESLREFIEVCREWYFASKSSRSFLRSRMLKWGDVMSYPNCGIIKPEEVAKYSDPGENDPVTVIINYLDKSMEDADDDFGLVVRTAQDALNMTVSWAFLFVDTATTGQRLTGRGYHTCEKGDELWLLAGSSVPVVLRRTEENSEFRYISSAFFDGLMEGEEWPEDGKEGLEMIYLV